MKKLLAIVVILGLFLAGTSGKNLIWKNKFAFIENNPQQTKRKKIFQQLSQNYYGSNSYWKELSMVNNEWDNSSDNDLIMPTLESLNKLKQERSLSASDEIYSNQKEDIIQNVIKDEPDSDKKEIDKS